MDSDPGLPGPKGSWIKKSVAAAAGMGLAWFVYSVTFMAYLGRERPEWAVFLGSAQPVALLNAAEARLNPPASAGAPARTGADADADRDAEAADAKPGVAALDLEAVKALVAKALVRDPNNSRGWRMMAQIAERGGDAGDPATLNEAAFQKSVHETYSLFWLMHKSAAAGEWPKMLLLADTIMRTRPPLAGEVTPYLVLAMDDPAGLEQLTRMLAAEPRWRSQFFYHFPRHIKDARAGVGLMNALKGSASPVRPKEVEQYINLLLQSRFYDVAYYVWLQLLTNEQLGNAGYIYNGSFETKPSPVPFDWQLSAGGSTLVEIAAQDYLGGRSALSVEFGTGRAETRVATQFTLMPPASYRMSGHWRGEMTGRRGLIWRITCLDSPEKVIGESAMLMGTFSKWQTFDVKFTVPATGCGAQRVQLQLDARSASDRLITGKFWFDEVAVERVAMN